MDLVGLQTFGMVARTGSVARAAQELNCVPSNVTSRIKALEHELGVVLFHRHSRGMELSSDGRVLLPYARQLVGLLEDARRAFAGHSSMSGQLRLGAMETTAALRLPAILKTFHGNFPGVALELTTGPTAALVEDVASFVLDGAFVAGPVGHPGLDEEVVVEEELVLVTANHHQTLDALLASGVHPTLLVYRAGCLYRQRLEAFLYSRGIAGTRHVVLGTVEGILGCVKADMGVSIFTRAAIAAAAERHEVSIHEIDPAFARIRTVFITPRQVRENAAMREFRTCMRTGFAATEEPMRPAPLRSIA
jgi:DNA-binding transcriptional LysR family regulator